IDDLDLKGKRVLLRADLNVPMRHGKVTDATRITRLLPTFRDLIAKGAKIVVLSHFDRPEGKYVPSMSLAPLADALSEALDGMEVKFGVDCIGNPAREAVQSLKNGEIVLLENLRFHAGEEKNDPAFTKELAALGEVYINDAFSCSHRAHASITGLAELLPAAAGRLMQAELTALETILEAPEKPMAAIVGGSKISTKLELLGNLVEKVDYLIIGGGMANTFLHAQGLDVGASLCETSMKKKAQEILKAAEEKKCSILLPVDVVVASSIAPSAPNQVVPVAAVPKDKMILDIGMRSLVALAQVLDQCKTVVWNGPAGVFETAPFGTGTVALARHVALLTREGKVKSIAGGGDTVAALSHAGLSDDFTYMSTAGGAFMEWLEGKTLPGVAALYAKLAGKRKTA
ncbi:MAG: phosphoglycerate kinase, partial [Alphaproteobacteria bacterium]|nr:phosphoglycerate kinase [Alphaproteobacteria bacterium]